MKKIILTALVLGICTVNAGLTEYDKAMLDIEKTYKTSSDMSKGMLDGIFRRAEEEARVKYPDSACLRSFYITKIGLEFSQERYN